MARHVIILLLVLFSIMLGGVREFIFVNLNYEIDHLANHRAFSYAHSAFSAAVKGWDLDGLVRLKWSFSGVFILLHLAVSVALGRVLFGDHRLRKPLLVGTTALCIAALVFFAANALHPAFGALAVKLLHMLQYPVALLFLLIASTLRRTPA